MSTQHVVVWENYKDPKKMLYYIRPAVGTNFETAIIDIDTNRFRVMLIARNLIVLLER